MRFTPISTISKLLHALSLTVTNTLHYVLYSLDTLRTQTDKIGKIKIYLVN